MLSMIPSEEVTTVLSALISGSVAVGLFVANNARLDKKDSEKRDLATTEKKTAEMNEAVDQLVLLILKIEKWLGLHTFNDLADNDEATKEFEKVRDILVESGALIHSRFPSQLKLFQQLQMHAGSYKMNLGPAFREVKEMMVNRIAVDALVEHSQKGCEVAAKLRREVLQYRS